MCGGTQSPPEDTAWGYPRPQSPGLGFPASLQHNGGLPPTCLLGPQTPSGPLSHAASTVVHPKLHSGDSCNLTWVPPRSDAKGLLWVLVIQRSTGLWPQSQGALTLYGKYIHGPINYEAAFAKGCNSYTPGLQGQVGAPEAGRSTDHSPVEMWETEVRF